MEIFLENFHRLYISHYDPDEYATHLRPLATQMYQPTQSRPNEAKRWGIAVRHGSWVKGISAGGSVYDKGQYQSTFSNAWIS